jgi:ribosomal protein S27E
MQLADGIRKVGFRRWYERALAESHLYLATAILCLVAALTGVEFYSASGTGAQRLGFLALVFAAGAGCVWALNRYRDGLLAAQRAAERSTCDTCGAYAALDVVRSGTTTPQRVPVEWVRVRCRKCGNEWMID